METTIDSHATYSAIRKKYGSVLEFCRQVEFAPPFFYMIIGGKRPQGNAGPAPIRTKGLLDRLESEGLLVRRDVANG